VVATPSLSGVHYSRIPLGAQSKVPMHWIASLQISDKSDVERRRFRCRDSDLPPQEARDHLKKASIRDCYDSSEEEHLSVTTNKSSTDSIVS
jgi:hypothetical protein